MTTPSHHLSPRDVFMHIFTIVMLYVGVTNILVVIFQLINIVFPDPTLSGYWELESARSMLRFGLATLFVAFPAYIVSAWLLERGYRQNPDAKNLRTRKWLIYFTLFVAALVAVIDLITLVYGFLTGDFTVRFGLKALAVLLVSAVVFIRYLWEIVRFGDEKSRWMIIVKPLRWASCFVVVALAIAGAVIVGSPASERARQLDMRRVNDLQYIQSTVVDFAATKRALPTNLSDLNDAVRGVNIPVDPLTAQPYAYEVVGPLSFRVCAEFATTSNQSMGAYGKTAPVQGGDVWTHEAGKQCFERTIDKDFLTTKPVDLIGR